MTSKVSKHHKTVAKEKTFQELLGAIARIQEGTSQLLPPGTRLTVSTLAKEAGINRATIYKYHPDIIARIELLNKFDSKQQLKEKRSELSKARDSAKVYRKLLGQAQKDKEHLVRINYQLTHQLEELERRLGQRDEVIAALKRQLNS